MLTVHVPSSECMTSPDSASHSLAVWSQDAVTSCSPPASQSQLITGAGGREGGMERRREEEEEEEEERGSN